MGSTLNAPLRAVIYTRISRDDTGDGDALERQEDRCRDFASSRGYQVVHVEKRDLAMSAYKDGSKRAGWRHVVEMMRAGECDVVIAWKLDRVTRRVKELVDLVDLANETGVLFATVDGQLDLTSAQGKAVATILGAVSQMEVELKAERQIEANRQRRTRGERWASGWRGFGYTLEGEIIEREAEMIRRAADDVLAGKGLRTIAREWRESGVSTPRSERGATGWTHQGVKHILLNPRNAGLQTYRWKLEGSRPTGEILGKGDWDPILTEEQHGMLLAFLTNPKRSTAGPGRKAANLLSGIARCGHTYEIDEDTGKPIKVCGKAVTGGTVAGPKGTRLPVYKCPDHHLRVTRDIDELVDILCGQTGLDGVLDEYTTGSQAARRAEIIARIARLDSRRDEIAAGLVAGTMSVELASKAEQGLTTEIRTLTAELEDQPTVDLPDHHPMFERLPDYSESWTSLSLEQRRELLKRHAEITLYPRGRGRRNVPLEDQMRIVFTSVPSREAE